MGPFRLKEKDHPESYIRLRNQIYISVIMCFGINEKIVWHCIPETLPIQKIYKLRHVYWLQLFQNVQIFVCFCPILFQFWTLVCFHDVSVFFDSSLLWRLDFYLRSVQ